MHAVYKANVDVTKKAIEYIENHLKEDISLEEVARHSAFSPFHFHRLFQSIVGVTVADYIRKRRLTNAACELISTDKRIIDIAVDHHFLTQESFTRAFKKMFYLTPGKYRSYSLRLNSKQGESKMMHTMLPKGWMVSGSHPAEYEMGVDKQVVHQGKASGYLKSKRNDAGGFATMMQMFKADAYRGERLRLSGFVKSENVEQWAGLWMRIDGKNEEVLAFDNMNDRPIQSTTNWNQYSIVLDVPNESVEISFGLLLCGNGIVWVDSLRFEVVDKTIPTTNIQTDSELPDQPVNLHFEE